MLLIHCLLLLPFFIFGEGGVWSMFYSVLGGEERAGCFTLIAFLMSCDRKCSVVLPQGTVG